MYLVLPSPRHDLIICTFSGTVGVGERQEALEEIVSWIAATGAQRVLLDFSVGDTAFRVAEAVQMLRCRVGDLRHRL